MQRTTPTLLLFNVANKVIGDRWSRSKSADDLRELDQRVLQTAFEFLTFQEKADSSNLDRSSPGRDACSNPVERTKNMRKATAALKGLGTAFLFLILVGGPIFGLYMFCVSVMRRPSLILDIALVVGVYLAVLGVFYMFSQSLLGFGRVFINRIFPSLGHTILQLCIFGFVVTQIIILAAKSLDLHDWVIWLSLIGGIAIALSEGSVGYEVALARGDWSIFRSTGTLQSDRALVFAALSSKQQQSKIQDREVTDFSTAQARSSQPFPAPPGVTEIVLDGAPADVFKEMRGHLASVRRYHRTVFWVVFCFSLSRPVALSS